VQAQKTREFEFAIGTSGVILYLRKHGTWRINQSSLRQAKKKRTFAVVFVEFSCSSAFEAKRWPFAMSDG
jgi:hypothetical protein